MMKSPGDASHQTGQRGLTSKEAAARMLQSGPNAISEPPVPLAASVARRFWEPVPWMLEAAIVLQLAIGERLEASIIAVLLIFNVSLASRGARASAHWPMATEIGDPWVWARPEEMARGKLPPRAGAG